jgi:hypothetical protein
VAGLAATGSRGTGTRPRIVVGVDTHKHTHVAAALDQLGSLLGSTTIIVNRAGYWLHDWVGELAGDEDGVPVVFGIEDAARYTLRALADRHRRLDYEARRHEPVLDKRSINAVRKPPSARTTAVSRSPGSRPRRSARWPSR